MRYAALLLMCSVVWGESFPPLDRLFTRPYAWGTSPSNPVWAKKASVLVFLWNSDGRRFRDLYAWQAETKKLVRLTNLESDKDELNVSEEQRDDRLRRYLAPPPGLGDFDVSKDGRRATFSYNGDLYLAVTDGSAALLRLTRTKVPETAPAFSPDGTLLASMRGGQVIIQNLSNGQLWQASEIEAGKLNGFDWSPDGKTLVCNVGKRAARQIPLPNFSGRVITARSFNRSIAGDEPEQESLLFVPVQGGKAQSIDRGGDDWEINDLHWSPDGQHLLIAQISPDAKKRQVGSIDLATAKLRVLFEETDSRWVDYGFAGWSPDSKQIFFTSEKDGFAHFYRVSLEGGKPAQITRGNWEIRQETFSSKPQWIGDWIYYSSTEDGTSQRQFYRIHPDGSGKQKLSTTPGMHIGSVSEDGRFIAIARADEKNPFDLWVNNQRVTKSQRPEFFTWSWPEIRYVQFPSKVDRKLVSAKIMLPPGGAPTQRPAIIYVHGAGIATSVLQQWGSYNEMRYVYNAYLANKGYIVLDLDYRGSTGHGRDWRTDVYLHLGGKDLEDVLGAVDYLKTLGSVDMNRLGIWGVSYGGFMTNMALFLSPGTFKAGSGWAAVNDWENYNARYTLQRLNTPAMNPEAYRRSSPIHFSNNLRDHLLVIHGMVDNNVLFQDAVQLTEKLVQEGKSFEHMFYPEESHGFIRDQTWIDALRRTTDWFERYLK
jgi:dipeptidyl aminopeptidase/acylaminoacyl peptidase